MATHVSPCWYGAYWSAQENNAEDLHGDINAELSQAELEKCWADAVSYLDTGLATCNCEDWGADYYGGPMEAAEAAYAVGPFTRPDNA